MERKVIPRSPAPKLEVNLLGSGEWKLEEQNPEFFTMIVFYRGLHCPLCKKYLEKLNDIHDELVSKGVDIIAISMDPELRARKSKMDWDIDKLKLGFGMDSETAYSWNLFLSESISESETSLFSEPGLFLIEPNNNVYYANVGSNPWGRPFLESFISLMDFLKKSGYPARGEVKL